jgi:hypothetical protein
MQECQRNHWEEHRGECKRIRNEHKAQCKAAAMAAAAPVVVNKVQAKQVQAFSMPMVPTDAHKCPYKPPAGVSGGVCPYRDRKEEKQLQKQIDRCLSEGLAGMTELYHLAQVGEMVIQTPLQDAAALVLNVLEKNLLELSEENVLFVEKAGQFITKLIHWTETEHIVKQCFERLACMAHRILVLPRVADTPWTPIYATILTRLYYIDKEKSAEFMGRVRSNPLFIQSMVRLSQDEVFNKIEHRKRFVNIQLKAAADAAAAADAVAAVTPAVLA